MDGFKVWVMMGCAIACAEDPVGPLPGPEESSEAHGDVQDGRREPFREDALAAEPHFQP